LDPVLEEFLSDPAADVSALHDVARIKAILEQCARDGRAISYSELLLNLGFRFTRPKMRGQGWWTGRADYKGEWTGPQAQAHIRQLQDGIFTYWQGRPV